MPNELDETDVSLINTAGRDIHVIDKQLPVTLDGADKAVNILVWFLFIIGGIVYFFRKAKAKTYFSQLQQKIQAAASDIDTRQQQRVAILQNTAKLVEHAIKLDKETFTEVARLRSGVPADDAARVAMASAVGAAERSINVALERYPELKAHGEIADAMRQNSYLEQEITAARKLYNDAVLVWNAQIFERWAKKYVAATNGYTTRIPFIASEAVKKASEGVFF